MARIVGRPRVLSPREWTLVSAWHDRGVPLAAVIEALEEIGARAGGGAAKLRSLAYAVPAVEEAWLAIREGRSARGEGAAPRVDRRSAASGWAEGREGAPVGSPLRSLVDALLDRLEAGESPHEIDAALDAEIEAAAPAEARAEAEDASRAALAPYRGRMAPAEFERTLARARVDRLRKRLGFPRLTLAR